MSITVIAWVVYCYVKHFDIYLNSSTSTLCLKSLYKYYALNNVQSYAVKHISLWAFSVNSSVHLYAECVNSVALIWMIENEKKINGARLNPICWAAKIFWRANSKCWCKFLTPCQTPASWTALSGEKWKTNVLLTAFLCPGWEDIYIKKLRT